MCARSHASICGSRVAEERSRKGGTPASGGTLRESPQQERRLVPPFARASTFHAWGVRSWLDRIVALRIVFSEVARKFPNYVDQRSTRRFPMRVPVCINRVGTKSLMLPGQTVNISTRGVLLT